MKQLDVNLENCYGIGKFSHQFDFNNNTCYLIYAPNGTMKSSFAKTFEDISKNDKKIVPCDRIYKDRKTCCEILSDGSPIDPATILVVDAENSAFDASHKITNFIASKELKERYDKIYNDLDLQKSEFIKKLKIVSSSTDCETEFLNTFSTSNYSFYESLESISDQLDNEFPKYDFKYNDVFDKKGNVDKFLQKNSALLDSYVDKYQNLLSTSSFFKKSGNSFGTVQANELVKSTEDNSFFDAGHTFLIDGKTQIDSAEKLRKLVEDEITKILSDEKLKETFDKVDKAIGANAELRAFKNVIEKDNLILVELDKYETFKEKVWLSYLSQLRSEAKELIDFFKSKKNDLEKIIQVAKKETQTWKEIVKTFNSRFYVPFTVSIGNQDDIVLRQKTANLVFHYADRNDSPVSQNKENLLQILSKGEQRAYYILQLLFDIESRKSNKSNLVVFDDVADSFDYKNKYAIIEYIKDLLRLPLQNFKMIVLTHNFDFYRTLSSRLNLKNAVLMATKDVAGQIELLKGLYTTQDVFKQFRAQVDEPKQFISLIAFVRNLIEYCDDNKSCDYKTLTDCLHIKDNSKSISAEDVFTIYKNHISKCDTKTISFGAKNIIELIHEVADSIETEPNVSDILLENKIVLAISIRLKAEKFMITQMTDFDLSRITTNQTRALFNEYRSRFTGSTVEILDRVVLMTPENIHINAFMYEPLIDMSLNHLKGLYGDISSV
jgi:hypothetical protein